MNQTLFSDAQAVIAQLQELATLSSTTDQNVQTAEQWREVVGKTLAFLEGRDHPVVFIGSVGVGKSSLISVLAGLLVGPPPSDRTSLKDHSVLAIGSGRTTVCEVRIRTARTGDKGLVGLVIDPFSPEEMKKEIEAYAEDQWTRSQPDAARKIEDDFAPAQEVHRVIRAMTGYAEYQETYMEDGTRRKRKVRPLDDVIHSFTTDTALAEHLLERANLPVRTQTEWWWNGDLHESLKELKNRFAEVNQGNEPTTILPHRMTVVVPQLLPESATDLDLTLIDSRGLDGKVESRRDLQEFLQDPRTVVVLCAPFKDAPGDTLRALLRSMASDAEMRQTIPRTLLVLLDQGDADQVNGAGGDREFGQDLKIDECRTALESAGLSQKIDRAQIIAFDALKDDRQRLLNAIDYRLGELRRLQEEALREQLNDARRFLDSAEDELRPALREAVDREIRSTLAQHPLEGAPLRDPLEGLYEVIRGTRYASVVYASCRRNGYYSNLDVYATVQAAASRAATVWLENLIDAVTDRLDGLDQDPSFERVQDHIRLRKRQFLEGQLKLIRGYAALVSQQVEDKLKADPVWVACQNEWRRGLGFKNRVLDHLEGWSRRQQGVITAHEHVDAAAEIPLLKEVARPVQPPRFTLHVRNLRVLREAQFRPEPVSLLIGANGAGKTTLLQILKLLRVAYERGLPEAVTIVFGGSSNLKSWGATEDERVEIGVDLGEASWRIELISREGSVDYLANERLIDRDRVIFSRDSLGNFTYGEERIESGPQIGLRALVDRGAHDAALRGIASFLQHITVYHDPDLWSLRMHGSSTGEDRHLHSRGTNALTLLRRWYQERASRHRYQFVVDGLRAAFPNTVGDLDFAEAGNTLVAHVYRPRMELPNPLASEANGVLQLLVLFCELAAADDGSTVAIDEPENSLHPYALRTFLSRTSRWAKQHNLTVLLATHSIVLLDELSAYPEQVFVMKAPETGQLVPTRLDQLYDTGWLSGFKLGSLYEQGEIGSNEDAI